MPPIAIWQVVTSLGVAGLAVFVFLLVVKRFGTNPDQGFQVSKLGKRASAALAFLVLFAVTLTTLVALVLFAPRNGSLITINIEGRPVDTQLPDTFSASTREALSDTLAGIERAVETHDWQRFLTYADPENLAFQRSIGIGNGQYIEEALGFNTVFNDLPGEHDADDPFARLDLVERFDITEVEASDLAAVRVTGVVTLQGGKQRPINFELTQHDLGVYRLNLPVG